MTTIVATPPPVEPVSIAEAKAWCRIDANDSSQDEVLTLLIQTMREYAENLTRRAFVPRQLTLLLPCWEAPIRLQSPPLLSVESVQYYDSANVLQTLASALYTVQAWKEPGDIVPALPAVWPATYYRDDAVRVNYSAGYAPAAGSPTDYRSSIPAAVRIWMHARVATLYDQRGQLAAGAFEVKAIPRDFCDGLLDALIVGTRFG